ncbi:hypothetical protein ABZZ74_12745 [Streptomyces sp. NPDC006476]|uniref:hypothetical protein n=1 Tax=Streptomyces sp. NPDC006476 TaxID=3157175 RepID=UPI00339F9515
MGVGNAVEQALSAEPDEQRREVSGAFDRVADEVLVGTWYRPRGTGIRRLLFDDHRAGSDHDAARHANITRPRATSRHWGPVRKGSAGWMTHYNAACFLALAMMLSEDSLPDGYDAGHWLQDCTRAALNQLDRSLRTSDSTLTGDWIAHDPDLDPLWGTDAGRAWARFMKAAD